MKSSVDEYCTVEPCPKASEKEKQRLQEIVNYDILKINNDDEGLLSITTLAALNSKTAVALVSIVDEYHQNFISRFGFPITKLSRNGSFCNEVIKRDDLLEVCDAFLDEQFKNYELVINSENPLRFYAGFPLKTLQGNILGALCVIDFKPHKLDEIQILVLKTLAGQVVINFELRKQNQKLKEALEIADKLSKAKDEFVSNMSHELRTPLNAINGYVDILGKSKLDEDQKEAVSIINSSCEILITLINDILDFSKINSGKLALFKSPFNLTKALGNILDLLIKKAEEKKNRLSLLIDEKIPSTIIGDKVRINQVIMNLVGNSLKFTNQGSVCLEVKLKEENKTQVTLEFSVKDTGIGIPEDKLESIFDRFEQVGEEITRKYGGTGLGLNISKNLVELHNSKLNVKSVLGKGTKFYFTIIYDKDSNVKILENKKNSNNFTNLDYLKNIKILICEDNLINIKLLKNLLKNNLMHIEFAENGRVAIEILNKNKNFDVVLMDIHMPEMNGIEATRFIRKTMKLTMPIIGFTANSSLKEKEFCLENGMNDYITKSFVCEEFHERLSKVLLSKKISSFSPDINSFLNKGKVIKQPMFKKDEQINQFKINYSKNLNIISSIINYKEKQERCSKEDSNNILKNNFQIRNKELVSKHIKKIENKPEVLYGDHSVIDKSSIIKSLKVISENDEAFEKELIELFLKEFPKQMGNLEFAIKLKNFDSLKFIIHKMKSSLLMLGLNKILEKIINIEKDMHKKDYCLVLNNFIKIKQDVESNYKFLYNYKNK